MKYLLSLLAGMVAGALLVAFLIYKNPLAAGKTISPLAVTQTSQRELRYPAVPTQTIAFVNNGQSRVKPHPARVQDLWENTIEHSEILVARLTDSRGEPAGIGIKFATMAEQPGLLKGEVLVNSVWHIWLTGRGGLFVDQVENRWPYLSGVVLPARLSSADSWRGNWFGLLSAGPGALGTARVTLARGSTEAGEAVEAWNAQAYAADRGPVAMEGHLTLALPGGAASQ